MVWQGDIITEIGGGNRGSPLLVQRELACPDPAGGDVGRGVVRVAAAYLHRRLGEIEGYYLRPVEAVFGRVWHIISATSIGRPRITAER